MAAAAAGKAATVAAVVVAVAAGVSGGDDSGWSSDEWRWCSGGVGCRKAAAVGMVTGGSGVLMVATRSMARAVKDQ
nr:hypothetical protein [Tanacetum cinerariifolium]